MRGFSVWSVAGVALFIAANVWATAQRGYWAVGGEVLFLLLPLCVRAARVIAEEERKSGGYDR